MVRVEAVVLVLAAFALTPSDSPTTSQDDPQRPGSFDIKADDAFLHPSPDLHDFDSSDFITFELPAKVQTEFFESVSTVPQQVSVLYLVSSKETNDIDLLIRDPTKKVIRQLVKMREANFKFKAEIAGEYSFAFLNRKVRGRQYMEKLAVTFAVHVGVYERQALNKGDITPVESNLFDMHRELSQFQMEQLVSDKRQEAHFQSITHSAVQSANQKVFWFSFLECAGVVGLSIWQVYYIKQLLSSRRVL